VICINIPGSERKPGMLIDITKIDMQQLLEQYEDLEATVELWIAANDAKDQQIRELQAECTQLRKRVARLSRLAIRQQRPGRKQLAHC
jgi:hypothetical protein